MPLLFAYGINMLSHDVAQRSFSSVLKDIWNIYTESYGYCDVKGFGNQGEDLSTVKVLSLPLHGSLGY